MQEIDSTSPDEALRREIDSIHTDIGVLTRAVQELERQYRLHEDDLDTFVRTPWWKKVKFVVDGWSLHKIMERPYWRPWRRWWTS